MPKDLPTRLLENYLQVNSCREFEVVGTTGVSPYLKRAKPRVDGTPEKDPQRLGMCWAQTLHHEDIINPIADLDGKGGQSRRG